MQENCPQIPVGNSVELGVALDAHKFSKDSCGKLCTNFSKALGRILTSFRCPQIQ